MKRHYHSSSSKPSEKVQKLTKKPRIESLLQPSTYVNIPFWCDTTNYMRVITMFLPRLNNGTYKTVITRCKSSRKFILMQRNYYYNPVIVYTSSKLNERNISYANQMLNINSKYGTKMEMISLAQLIYKEFHSKELRERSNEIIEQVSDSEYDSSQSDSDANDLDYEPESDGSEYDPNQSDSDANDLDYEPESDDSNSDYF